MISIYETQNGHVAQLDRENCLLVSFKDMEYKLKICSFIALKSKIDRIDIESKLLSSRRCDSLEIIPICHSENILVLTLDEILEIRDLFSGVVVLLELNSIVHQRIHRAVA